MKKPVALLFGLALSIALTQAFAGATESLKVDPQVLGEMRFRIPHDASQVEYLGLAGTGAFRLNQVKAALLIVEVFSMYCPYCLAEAPNINKLYDLIESNPQLKGRIKLVGVGAGNTPYEVDIFRKKFNIPFPLFPDDNFAIQKSSGGRPFRTPTFIVLRKQDPTHYKLIEVHQGRIDKIEEFFNRVSQF